MAKINGIQITKELLAKAMQCDTPEDLMKLAKENGAEMTKEEAEAYLSEMADIDLDSDQLKKAAGGFGEGKDYEKKPGFEQCRGYNSPFPHKM
ncbi:MAG: hypothetical protein IKZ66_00555 [Schwartzia sp.]|nr:hypothetical protein [Schwartzia sp. (in: firmicutes)]